MCAALMGLCVYKCVCFLCLCVFVWARTRPSRVCLCEYVYTYIHIYTYVYIHVYILTYKYACIWNSFTHLIYTLDTKGNSWYKTHQNGHFDGVLTNMATLWSDKGRVHIWTTFDGRNIPEGIRALQPKCHITNQHVCKYTYEWCEQDTETDYIMYPLIISLYLTPENKGCRTRWSHSWKNTKLEERHHKHTKTRCLWKKLPRN